LDIIWQGRTLLVACVGSNSRQKEINWDLLNARASHTEASYQLVDR
jgi:hypothetical protein